jgi:uncharacterized membrane protein YdjX (TVP38/TMEM64 family)
VDLPARADRVGMTDLLWLCLWLFIDGATLSVSSTVLLLHYGSRFEPWKVAVLGGAASALGSSIQLLVLRWALSSRHSWMRRLAPSREKLEKALASYPSASFVALTVARATPLPDAPLKLVAAFLEYPVYLYGLASFLGSIPYFFALALIGSKLHVPLWVVIAALVLVVVGVVIDRWRKRGREA